MQRLSNFLLIFLCFSVPKALFVIVILFMKLLYIISGKKLYGGYVAGGLALASLVYVVYGATEGKQHFQIREVSISSDDLPSGFDGYRIVQISDIHSGSWSGNSAALQKAETHFCTTRRVGTFFRGLFLKHGTGVGRIYLYSRTEIRERGRVYCVMQQCEYSFYKMGEREDSQEENQKL